MSKPAKHFNGEHPFGRPEGSDASMFIQWKGTDVCMDFICECGANVHGDGYFAYNVECGACGAFYHLGTQVIAKRVTEPDGACLYLAHDEPDNSPPETVTLPSGQEATVIATVAEGVVLWTEEEPKFATGGPVSGPGRLLEGEGEDAVDAVTFDAVRAANPSPAIDPEAVASDAIRVCLSPGEAMIPGPNGLIHIRGAYGDQPMQVTEVNVGNLEDERT